MNQAGPALGPDWVPGADGLPFRRAARVVLLDERDRLLLVRGHDVDDRSRTWWFTVGGGIDAGESPDQAAIREIAEETGLRIAVEDLLGPVLTRSAVFDFQAQHVRQDEVFYLARLVGEVEEISREGWTDIERDVMDEVRWWEPADLHTLDVEIFPAELPELLPELRRALREGWDGTVRHLGLQREDTAREASAAETTV